MKQQVRFKTIDGVWHDSSKDAKKHLDVLYTNYLCKMASEIVGLDFKYQAVKEYLDANLYRFIQANNIKLDMNLPENQDDEE